MFPFTQKNVIVRDWNVRQEIIFKTFSNKFQLEWILFWNPYWNIKGFHYIFTTLKDDDKFQSFHLLVLRNTRNWLFGNSCYVLLVHKYLFSRHINGSMNISLKLRINHHKFQKGFLTPLLCNHSSRKLRLVSMHAIDLRHSFTSLYTRRMRLLIRQTTTCNYVLGSRI